MQNLEKKKIEAIETEVERLNQSSREQLKEMYEILEYLRTTNRFKENKAYKKSSFWTYLQDRFAIREGTFRENSRAFLKHPQESVEYGVGLVAKVQRVCKPEKIKPVFEQIKTEQSKRKTPLNRQRIEEIIQSNAKKSEKIQKTITDWQAMYNAEMIAHEQTRENLRDAMDTITMLKKQIERLKSALLEEVA